MGSQVVTMTFDAQTAAFVTNVLKAKEALEATARTGVDAGEKIKAAGDKAMDATSKMKDGAGGAAQNITALATGFLSVGKVIEMVGAMWQEHLAKMAEKTKNLRKDVEDLSHALAPAGQLEMLPQVREKLSGITSSLFSKRDVGDVYGQISKRTGGEFSTDEKARATRAAITAGEAGHEDLAGFGETFLKLHKFLPQAKDTELGSLTAQLMKSKSGLDDQDIRLLAHDKNKMRALELIAARGRSGENAKGVNALEETAQEEPDAALLEKARKHKHKLTDEDKRKLRLSQIPVGDRIGAMLEDESLVPANRRLMVQNLRKHFDANEFGDAMERDELFQQKHSADLLEGRDSRFSKARRLRRNDVFVANKKQQGEEHAAEDAAHKGETQNENAEVTGLDPGMLADFIAALMRASDVKQNFDNLFKGETQDYLRQIVENTRKSANNDNGGNALKRDPRVDGADHH